MSGTTQPFTSALNDPFDLANADNLHQPGFLGVSPDVWRSLANFGGNLASAANARTAGGFLANGPGFAGPFGAAISQSQGQGLQRGQALSDIGYRNAAARGQQIQNLTAMMNLPLAQAQAQLQYRMLTDPQFRQQMVSSFGMNGSPLSAGTTAAPQGAQGGAAVASGDTPQGGSDYAKGIHSLEGTGQNPYWPASAGGPDGDYGFTGGTWQEFAKENPQYFAGKSPDEILSMRKDAQLGATATDWYAAKNAPVLKAAGIDPTPQNLGIAHALGGAGAAGVLKFPDDASLPQVLAVTQPNAAGAILRENPQYQRMTVGDLKQKYAKIGSPQQPYQVAQAGNGPLPVPGEGQNAAPQMAQAQAAPQMQGSGGVPQAPAQSPAQQQATDLMSRASQAEQQANALEQQRSAVAAENVRRANLAKMFPMMAPYAVPMAMPPGDPAALRTEAQQLRQSALELQTAGPKEAEVSANKVTMDRFGNIYKGTQFLGRGSEVKPVWNPTTQQYEYGDVGGVGAGAIPTAMGGGGSTGIPSAPGPGQIESAKSRAAIPQQDIAHDRTILEDDLSHVVENVLPAKQQLFQLRSKIDAADTGAQGDLRADVKNFVQTYFPSAVSQFVGDASPAQEFRKLALMGSGKQERGDLGARGGFRAIELYMKANPTMENQPTANHDMANALLVFHQAHEDYATGATSYYNQNHDQYVRGGEYSPLSNYDSQYIRTFRPELYSAAISAINGSHYADWSKGLSNKQIQIVGGILQRADPTAVVDIAGHQVPVASFKTTVGPSDLMGAKSAP